MEKSKLFNLIAGIAGAAAVALPALGNSHYDFVYWMFGSLIQDGRTSYLLHEVKPDDMGLASLTIVSGVLIAVAAAMFFLSMVPKMKMPLFTMLGWILGLGGCATFMIFGFGADIDGPLFLWEGTYPLGIFAAFASGGLGLVSWILQTRVK